MDKQALVNQLIKHLEEELAVAIQAANDARAASTDEQSVAETQYDTLAIEAGYLAEGQAKRAQQLKIDIEAIKSLPTRALSEDEAITLGALVQLHNDANNYLWYLIAPAGAGYSTMLGDDQITFITPKSPLGQQLVDAYLGDEVQLVAGHQQLSFEISNII
ncbi:hypothetical protein [Thalassotalea ganghwensis]